MIDSTNPTSAEIQALATEVGEIKQRLNIPRLFNLIEFIRSETGQIHDQNRSVLRAVDDLHKTVISTGSPTPDPVRPGGRRI